MAGVWFKVVAAGLATIAPFTALSAQTAGVTAEDAIANAKQVYGPPPPTRNCSKPKKDQDANEIVVCAKQQDDSQFRVKSTSELDPNSREALDDGRPHAPDLAGAGIFKGKPTVSGACLLQGCPPPPAYVLDFSLLPDAPEGSDADKIAKGEKKAD